MSLTIQKIEKSIILISLSLFFSHLYIFKSFKRNFFENKYEAKMLLLIKFKFKMNRSPLRSVQNIQMSREVNASQQVIMRSCVSTTMKKSMQEPNILNSNRSGNAVYSSSSPQNNRQNIGFDVACFIMSIEIERLVNENDKLKYRLKEVDDKLLDRNSYEQQIEDLQQRLQEYSYQEMVFEQTITTIKQESETWKSKFYNFESSYSSKMNQANEKTQDLLSENQNLKDQLQVKEYQWSKEMSELKMIYQNKQQSFELESKKLRDSLEYKQRELESLKGDQLTQEQNLKIYRSYEPKLKDYENKIGLLVTETERLNGLLRQKLEEIELSKRRIKQLEMTQYDTEKYRNELKQVTVQFELKQRENEDLRRLLSSSEQQLQKYKQQEDLMSQLQNKSALLASEIDRLNQVLRDKVGQLEEWRIKCNNTENQLNEFKSRMNKMDILQQQLKEITDKFQMNALQTEELKSQNNQLNVQKQGLENQNRELQNRLGLISSEIERLNTILKQKVHEIEEYKQSLYNAENQLNDLSSKMSSYSNELKSKNQEISDLKEKLKQQQQLNYQNESKSQQLMKNLEEWQQQCHYLENELENGQGEQAQEYENRIGLLSQEIERLNAVIQQKQIDLEESKRQFLTLKGQKQNELDEWISKYTRLEASISEYRKIEERAKHYQMRLVITCAELDRLNLIQLQYFQDQETYSQNISNLQLAISQKEEQLYKNMERNSLLSKLLDEEKNKRTQLQEKCLSYEQKIALLSTEIERINQMYRVKQQDFDELKQKLGMVEIQMNQFGKIKEYENKIVFLSQEIERLQQQQGLLRNELDDMRYKNEGLEQRCLTFQKQVEEWRSKYQSLEIQISSLNSYKAKYIDLENKCAMLSSEVERLQMTIRQKQVEKQNNLIRNSEIDQLQQQIASFVNYEENVRVLSAEIDRLQSIVNVQENELSRWRLMYADGGALNRKIQDQQLQFVVMFAEIESLRSRVQEKEREVEEVRRSSLAPYRR